MEPLEAIWLGSVPYSRAEQVQREIAQARRLGRVGDVVLMLEHPPVYTVGRNGEGEHLGLGPDYLRSLGADYCEVDRGGSVTFHGPGQMVAYPIVDLASIFPVKDSHQGDVLLYLRALEGALIDTLALYGIAAGRRSPYTGVWVGREKLAAIGVKLAHGITTHGVGLNVSTDLTWFSHVVPCGIRDGGVTSMRALGCAADVPTVATEFAVAAASCLGRELTPAQSELRALLVGLERPAPV